MFLEGEQVVQGNSTKQQSSQGSGAGDQTQNSEPTGGSNASEGSSSHADSTRVNSLIERISSDQATIQLLIWLEMMQLFVQSLSKNPQAVQQLLEQENNVGDSPESVQQIRAQVPRLVDIARRPEFASALKNPRVLAAIRSIQREMDTIRSEAPSLVAILQGIEAVAEQEEQAGAAEASTSSQPPSYEQSRTPSGGDASSSVDPELLYQLYHDELDKLTRMGFSNKAKSLEALRVSNGNMDAAVEFLLNSSQS